jgi:hypothetical protein
MSTSISVVRGVNATSMQRQQRQSQRRDDDEDEDDDEDQEPPLYTPYDFDRVRMGQFSSVSAGYAPTPRKGLYKELQNWCTVRPAAEYNTTRRCARCVSVLADTQHPRVLQCNDNICKTWWNRDINAAINIRYVSVFRNDHDGQRPDPFIPPYLQQQGQPQQQQQQQEGGNQQEEAVH